MSDSEESISDIEVAANAAIQTLIPAKSRLLYELEYSKFEDWCAKKKVESISEKVLLAYFSIKSEKEKPSSLWSHYSMLRCVISIKRKVDISRFTQLLAFLKRKSEGYKPKKSDIFAKEDIHRFLREADDDKFLLQKVALIFGIFGACRREELKNVMINDVDDRETFITVTIPNTKTNVLREFVVTKGNITGYDCVESCRKYVSLRPKQASHNRFFVFYRNGKCTSQPVGVNTFGRIPKNIAIYLGLANPGRFTGHCFRRSSASLLADTGADIHMLKRHGGWRSSTVAEGYVETSLENKKIIATKIMGDHTTVSRAEVVYDSSNIGCAASTSSASSAGVVLSHCDNFVVHVYNK